MAAMDPNRWTLPPQAWTMPVNAEVEDPGRPVFPSLCDGGPVQGLPLGGIGTGGIGRDYQGGFGRWTVKAGSLKHFLLPANAFSLWVRPSQGQSRAHVLYGGTAPGETLQAWSWPGRSLAGTYHALFPKAWFHYPPADADGIELVCEQFSPVIPHAYRESSLPVGLFNWRLYNPTAQPVEAALMFTFTNLVGWFNDFGDGLPLDGRRACQQNRPVSAPLESGEGGDRGQLRGILCERARPAGRPLEGDGQMCLAAREDDRTEVTWQTSFDPAGDGAAVWRPFAAEGRLPNNDETWVTLPIMEIAGAVAARTHLAPGEEREIAFVLSWDLPVVAFGSGREHWRKYVDFVPTEGDQAAPIAAEALRRRNEWSSAIDGWHRSVNDRGDKPDWYHRMLFNESYLLVDGFTVWTAGTVDGDGRDHFGIIECPDYPFYNTLDLWVYGSFLLLYFWPELERIALRDFSDLVTQADARRRLWLWKGEGYAAKEAGAAPHDLGAPREDPFSMCNSYTWQNSNLWRDLNADFVLLVYRDTTFLQDDELLVACWPAVRAALERLESFDADGDGLIDNTGYPDQTLDNIRYEGPSAYCNSLWLGSLAAATQMATRLQEYAWEAKCRRQLKKATAAFEATLWNGACYHADRDSAYRQAVFIEQLFGVGYASLCGLGELLPRERIEKALRTVFARNHVPGLGVRNFSGLPEAGEAVGDTVFNPADCQTHEILSGINMAFAGHLQQSGLKREAMAVLSSLHEAIYRGKGLWFRTPAAWNGDGDFRAIMNLRPLVIWALEYPDEVLAAQERHDNVPHR